MKSNTDKLCKCVSERCTLAICADSSIASRCHALSHETGCHLKWTQGSKGAYQFLRCVKRSCVQTAWVTTVVLVCSLFFRVRGPRVSSFVHVLHIFDSRALHHSDFAGR